jgi:hypothetical protein
VLTTAAAGTVSSHLIATATPSVTSESAGVKASALAPSQGAGNEVQGQANQQAQGNGNRQGGGNGQGGGGQHAQGDQQSEGGQHGGGDHGQGNHGGSD